MTDYIDTAQRFADALQSKFQKQVNAEYAVHGYEAPDYSVQIEPGQKYIRLAVSIGDYNRHVHAFIERSTGALIKAAGWKIPAKDKGGLAVRYDLSTDEGFEEALSNADPHGAYLYASYTSSLRAPSLLG